MALKAEFPDNFEWSEQAEYWQSHKSKASRGRRRKFNYRDPLVLCGHGMRIRIDRKTLFVQNGFTHYPQKREEIRLFPGDANLPDRIVILDGDGGISFDALKWMSEQNISLVQLDWRGRVSFVGGDCGYSGKPGLVERQLKLKNSSKAKQIAKWLIAQKIENSISTICEIAPKGESREIAIVRLKKSRSDIAKPNNSISNSRILGIEGIAAAAHFRVFQGILLNWTGSKKHPIPPSWLEIGPRQMAWRDTAQNARHPINAMLNYGYGILVSQVRTLVLAAGLDPSIGILHGSKFNKIPLIYDLMEPLRPLVDKAILEFALTNTFKPADFTINRFGGCRLNPQLAKSVTKTVPPFPEASKIVGSFVRHIDGFSSRMNSL